MNHHSVIKQIPILIALLLVSTTKVESSDQLSGRPPLNALERYEPRVYGVGFEVEFTLIPPPRLPRDIDPDRFHLRETEFYFPIIHRSTFSRVNPDSMQALMWLNEVADTGINDRGRFDSDHPFGTSLAVLPLPNFSGHGLRWRFEYEVQVWNSRIDDTQAGRVAWPRTWPSEVRDGLRPQRFIESDHENFKQAVERITEGNIRLVPPYHAAKELVRIVLQQFQISEGRTHRRELGIIEGLNVNGALHAASEGMGTPHDLVCVCVAMLRAAGIPARPVIGFRRVQPRDRFELVSWAEFYLPETGWIPFDPVDMQGKGLHRDVSEPWPEFGSIDDLSERIPLSFHFTPERGQMGPGSFERPRHASVWGWNPGRHTPPHARQQIRLSMESRGRGEEDEH